MSYLVIDVETSGLIRWDQPADGPDQPRLASWCMIFADDDLQIEHEASSLVFPLGWTMPPEAAAVNQLTTGRLVAEGETIRWPLSLYALALDGGRTLVAHGVAFDSKIMRGEMRRAGMESRYTENKICTMMALRNQCHRVGGGSKFPSLATACEIILGRPPTKAHDCVGDAHDCLDLLRAIKDRGIDTAMRSPMMVSDVD